MADQREDQQGAETERPVCPKCGSADVRRSKSVGLWGALMQAFGRWPFRCRSCRSKFYRYDPSDSRGG